MINSQWVQRVCLIASMATVWPMSSDADCNITPMIVKKSIVSILSGENRGTGFVIAPGFVVTAAHVLEASGAVKIKTRYRESATARRAYQHPALDLTLLQVDTGSMQPIPLATEPTALTQAWAIGFQEEQPRATASEGVYRYQNGNTGYTTAEVWPGQSGGPVINCEGVIGMIRGFGAAVRADGVAVKISDDTAMIPADAIKKFVEAVKVLAISRRQ